MFWKRFLGSTKLYIIYVSPKRFVKDCFLGRQWNNFIACFDKADLSPDLCYIVKEMLQHKACMPCEARLKKNQLNCCRETIVQHPVQEKKLSSCTAVPPLPTKIIWTIPKSVAYLGRPALLVTSVSISSPI